MIGNIWFECKIEIEKQVEGGLNKKSNESYLVNALSFGEAEQRILKEQAPFASGSLEVKGIAITNYCELFFNDAENADKYYKIKCNYIEKDEEKGIEKKRPHYMLVQAADYRGAAERFEEGMKGTMVDWEVAAITETRLLDVYPFAVDDNQNNSDNYRTQSEAQPAE